MIRQFIDWLFGVPYMWEYKLEDLKPGDRIMADYGYTPLKHMVIINRPEKRKILLKNHVTTEWFSYDYRFDNYIP